MSQSVAGAPTGPERREPHPDPIPLALAASHARYHDMPGNLLWRDSDCGWEGCTFVSSVQWALHESPEVRAAILAPILALADEWATWGDHTATYVAELRRAAGVEPTEKPKEKR